MHGEPDDALLRHVRRQHGAFSRRQAEEAGFSARMITRRVANGAWHKLAPGVYVVPAYPRSWEQRCHGALLGEPSAVLGATPSAPVYRLRSFNRGGIELIVPPGSNHRTPLARVRQSSLVEPKVVDGLRVNAVELVLFELAGRCGFDRIDRAFEDAVLRGLTSLDAMAGWYEMLAGSRRPGLATVRRLLELRVDGMVPSESELERNLFELLDDPRIPKVTRQSPFPWCPGGRQRVDAYIAEWGMLLEGDGRLWHARLDTMDEDKRRDQRAAAHGYLPLRLTWRQVTTDRAAVREDIIAAGAHRAAWRSQVA